MARAPAAPAACEAPAAAESPRAACLDAGVGYQSEDSAGQQNIFAVEPKQYVAQDNTVGGGSLVGVGSLIALALLGGGLTALINTDGGAAEDMSGYKTATEYAQAFRAAGSAPSTQI